MSVGRERNSRLVLQWGSVRPRWSSVNSLQQWFRWCLFRWKDRDRWKEAFGDSQNWVKRLEVTQMTFVFNVNMVTKRVSVVKRRASAGNSIDIVSLRGGRRLKFCFRTATQLIGGGLIGKSGSGSRYLKKGLIWYFTSVFKGSSKVSLRVVISMVDNRNRWDGCRYDHLNLCYSEVGCGLLFIESTLRAGCRNIQF